MLQATRLCRDSQRAADLVHNAFVQFVLTRPDLEAIGNIDAYLYGMLRNLHVSEVRRLARLTRQPLSILDYDTAAIGVHFTHPHDLLQVPSGSAQCASRTP